MILNDNKFKMKKKKKKNKKIKSLLLNSKLLKKQLSAKYLNIILSKKNQTIFSKNPKKNILEKLRKKKNSYLFFEKYFEFNKNDNSKTTNKENKIYKKRLSNMKNKKNKNLIKNLKKNKILNSKKKNLLDYQIIKKKKISISKNFQIFNTICLPMIRKKNVFIKRSKSKNLEKYKKLYFDKNTKEIIYYLIFIYNKNKYSYNFFIFKGNQNLSYFDVFNEIEIWMKLKIDKNTENFFLYDLKGKFLDFDNNIKKEKKKLDFEKLENFIFYNLNFDDFMKKKDLNDKFKIFIFSNLRIKNLFNNNGNKILHQIQKKINKTNSKIIKKDKSKKKVKIDYIINQNFYEKTFGSKFLNSIQLKSYSKKLKFPDEKQSVFDILNLAIKREEKNRETIDLKNNQKNYIEIKNNFLRILPKELQIINDYYKYFNKKGITDENYIKNYEKYKKKFGFLKRFKRSAKIL